MHALSRLVRGDNNFLLNTNEFTRIKNNKTKEENADYFDKKFLICILSDKKITKIDAIYLLDPRNYNKELKSFQQVFI